MELRRRGFGFVLVLCLGSAEQVRALGNGSGASAGACPKDYVFQRNGRTTMCSPPPRPIPFSGDLQQGPVSYARATDKQLEALRVYDLKEDFNGINVYPRQKDEQINYKGWVLPSNVSDLTVPKIPSTMTVLPAPYTFSGHDKCHFAKYLSSPKSDVRAGDVLIYFVPHTADASKSLYRNLVKGMGHAAVVIEKQDGTVMHVDSPHSWSKSDFSGKSFHILRLRQFPADIKSNKAFEDAMKDPEKKERLRAFITERNFRIAAINTYTNRLYDNGYGYSSVGDTKVLDNKEWMQKVISRGHTAGLSFYCSELAYTPLSLAGIARPQARNLLDTLQVADEFLKRTSAKENISRKQAVKRGIDEMGVEYNGADIAVLDAILGVVVPASKFLPDGGEKAIHEILEATPEEGETKVAQAPESVRKWLSSQTIGPSDFFNSIYDTKSDYFYVGTYIEGGLAETRNKSTQEGQADRSVGFCR